MLTVTGRLPVPGPLESPLGTSMSLRVGAPIPSLQTYFSCGGALRGTIAYCGAAL